MTQSEGSTSRNPDPPSSREQIIKLKLGLIYLEIILLNFSSTTRDLDPRSPKQWYIQACR